MTGRFSVKFGGRKAAFIVTAALAAVVIATTLLLSACAAVEAEPPMADETYMGGYDTKAAFDF